MDRAADVAMQAWDAVRPQPHRPRLREAVVKTTAAAERVPQEQRTFLVRLTGPEVQAVVTALQNCPATGAAWVLLRALQQRIAGTLKEGQP